jgi:DNA topoisomerase IA
VNAAGLTDRVYIEDTTTALWDRLFASEQERSMTLIVEGDLNEQEGIRDMFDRFHHQVTAWNPAEPAGPDLISKMHAELKFYDIIRK